MSTFYTNLDTIGQMNVLLFGKNAKALEALATPLGLDVVEDRPDVIITYGGDGTLLAAERHFPSIPKLPIRDSAVCIKCEPHTNEQLLQALAEKKLAITEHDKLEAQFDEQKLVALNDIVVRNKLPTHAVRLSVFLNDKELKPLVIGDGVVAATAFGSSGYFHSITQQSFEDNFGLAFNNPTKPHEPLFFSPEDHIRVRIIRGPATLSTDNSSTIFPLADEDEVLITGSKQKAKILQYETLRCHDCKVAHDKRLITD